MLDWDNLRIFLELTRSQTLVETGKKLGINHSTIARRVQRFEQQIGSQLFERNNHGYKLTADGFRLLAFAEQMENTMYAATEEISGNNNRLSGQVRIGTTEGFGSFFIAAHIANFCAIHPNITVDLLPIPRFVNLSKHEADISISLERPSSANHVFTKLCDYTLTLYGSKHYLANHEPIHRIEDLEQHPFIGYIDDLVFSEELRYKDVIAPNSFRAFRSTSIIAQYTACCNHQAIAILPCFLAQQSDQLQEILPEQTSIKRNFWLVCSKEQRQIARIAALWNYLRQCVEINQDYLNGRSTQMQWVKPSAESIEKAKKV